jgi:hypothetical protein
MTGGVHIGKKAIGEKPLLKKSFLTNKITKV